MQNGWFTRENPTNRDDLEVIDTTNKNGGDEARFNGSKENNCLLASSHTKLNRSHGGFHKCGYSKIVGL